MKLHLPIFLRKTLLTCVLAAAGLPASMSAAPVSAAEGAAVATYTINTSNDPDLIAAPAGSLVIMNLNGGHLKGAVNTTFDVQADLRIDALSINDGNSGVIYNFSGDFTGSGVFERTSDAKSVRQTYMFAGDMSQYSGEMKLNKVDDGSVFKFVGNTSGSGAISIAKGNGLVVDAATMLNNSITVDGSLDVLNTSTFTGEVALNGVLTLSAGAEIINNGSFIIGQNAVLDLSAVGCQEDASGNRTYALAADSSTGEWLVSSFSAANVSGVQTTGYEWSISSDGAVIANCHMLNLSFSGGSLNWNTDAENKAFSANGEAVAFRTHDNVSFDGVSLVTLGEDIQVTRMSVANDSYVQVSTAGRGLAASEVSVDGTLKYQLDGSVVSVGELAGSGAIEIGNTSSQSGNFTVSGDCAGFSGSITARGDMTLHLSDGLLTNPLATIIIDSGAVLNPELGFLALLERNNIQTKGSGVINLQMLEGVYLQKHVEINNNYEVHSDNFFLNGYWSDNRWNTFFRVGEGKSFSVINHFAVESCVDLQISGGTVQSGTMHLGHWAGNFRDFWGKLTMTGGKLTTGTISLKLNHSNSINISGGTLEFTDETAVDRESNTVTTIRIVGADNQNRVNFLATQCDWSLDGAGLNNKPVIGNVTIDAGNTHGITLRNVSLTGSIVNNAELALDSGISVAAGTTTTLSGDGQLSVHRTIANAGTFNLQVSQVSLDRSNLEYLQSGTEGATVRYSQDGTTYNTDGSENGFRFQTDGRYYLVAGGQYTVAQGSQVQLGDEAYELFCDGTGIGFIYPENLRSVEYFVNCGNVTVGAEAQAIAESYEINGGTMVLNAGSVAGESVHFNSASSALHIGGESSITGALVLNQGSVTVSGGHLSTLNVAGGSATLNGGSADTLLVGGSNGSVEVTGAFSTTSLRLSENGSATLTIKDGGNLTLTGTNNEHSTNRSFMLAHWPYASTLRQEGGLLNSPGATMFISWDGTGTYEALGGVANLAGISFWGSGSNIRGKFYLGESDGGTARVNIGANGISDISGSVQILLGNGTLGATADWRMHHNPSFTVSPVQLISTGQGTIFDTSDANYPTIGRTITVDVPFTGIGKLVKQGVGTLILNRASTHSGGTVIEAGELVAGNETALGSGKVSLAAGSLKLNTDLTISELEYTGGALNLNGNTLNITGGLAASRQLSLNSGILNIQDGAICSGQGIIALEGSSATLRLQNARLSHEGYDLVFNAGTTLEVSGSNTITGNVNLQKGSSLIFTGSEVEIVGNSSSSFSYAGGTSVHSFQTLREYGSVTFSGNSASNTSEASGGAIYGKTITLSDNGSVGFEGNVATRRGGAIAGSSPLTSQTSINENDSVTFIGNRVESETSGADGGAIYCINNEVNHNKKVSFKDNVASSTVNWAAGGAIRGSASISGNDEVRITGNKAQTGAVTSQGGALFGWEYQLNDNGVLEFFGNSAIAASADGSNAVALGGAIYAFQVYGGTPEYRELSICNNGDTLFQQNSEVRDGVYRLRSIYTEDAGNGAVALSAAAGKRIEFRDSIYIGTGNTLSLNADYAVSETSSIKQQGDIIFTGKSTENDLYIVKGNIDGTEEEIQASRTSEVHGAVNLYGGRLRVEEQAVLKTTAGLAVAEGSNATVKIDNAELDAGTSDIAIGATGRLELSNGSIVRANEIIIDDEATLALSCSDLQTRATFALSEAVAAGTTAYNTGNTVVIDGDLTLNGGATLVADNAHFIMTEGSVLTFNASVEKKINLVLTLGTVYEPDVPIILFTGVESMRFIYNGTELTDGAAVNPGDFFTGAWINESTTFTYDAEAGTFFVMNVNSLPIPEPSTTTLGLLALAGLAARRRRLD
ncbi:MAG: autotransporter-associated beta strand repeat-containing protein [Akkermansia sp.]|nr:autotransporter-associated beta strand repeat-containing protein [Akkermansia sp.]